MFQKIILAGNLGRNPELRYTPSGQAVCNLNLATNRVWNDSNGNRQTETTWFRVNVWGKMAENAAKYLTKGRGVLVEGRLNPDENGNPRTWTAQDGSVRTSFEVTATSLVYLPSADRQQNQSQGANLFDIDDDIPFDLPDDDPWADI